jgi:hypothetical protein
LPNQTQGYGYGQTTKGHVQCLSKNYILFARTRVGRKKDEEEEEEEQVLEEYVSLASTVMGDKDWTTDLLLLMHLDRRLSTLSQQMLKTQEPNAQDSRTIRPFFHFICDNWNCTLFGSDLKSLLPDVLPATPPIVTTLVM